MRQIRDDERNGRPRSLPCLPRATGCSSAFSRCHIQSYTAIACNPLQPSCLIVSTRVYLKILIVLARTEPIHHEPVHREETPTHEPAVCANWCGLVALSTSPAADWSFSGSPLVSLCGQCRDKVTQQSARGGVSEAARVVQAPNTAECDNPKSWAQKLVKLYFTQLTKGCGNAWCCNPQCATGSGIHSTHNLCAAIYK